MSYLIANCFFWTEGQYMNEKKSWEFCLLSPKACTCMCAQSCPTLCNPMDCSPPGSSFHGISQARILEWVPISSFRGSSQPRDRTNISCSSCIHRQIFFHCTTWGAPKKLYTVTKRPTVVAGTVSVQLRSLWPYGSPADISRTSKGFLCLSSWKHSPTIKVWPVCTGEAKSARDLAHPKNKP